MDAITHDALIRIQIEYIEMPHLELTRRQIHCLCNLPEDRCEPALNALLAVGFLARTPDGAFLRRAAAGPLGATTPAYVSR